MHDLSRLFAVSRLREAEGGDARRHHAAHYASVLRVANRQYLEGGEALMRSLELFDLEWGNVQAGRSWAAGHAEDDENAARLCSAYAGAGSLLFIRQHPRQRIEWLEAALAAARRLEDRQGEGNHLGNLGLAYANLGEVREAIEYYEQALTISCEIGDRQGEGSHIGNLGGAYANLGEVREADRVTTSRLWPSAAK